MAGGFGGAVKLQGEQEYRNALNQITQNLREVGAEMKATTSQFDKNDRSAEALAAQSEVLTKKMGEQEKKLSLLEDEYAKMLPQFEKQSQAHNKLIDDYEKEKVELDRIKATLGETSNEYKAQKAVIEQYEKDIKKSSNAMDANERSMSQMRTAINNARADVNNTSREIRNLGQETETAGNKAEASSGDWSMLGATIADMAADILQKAADALKDFVTQSENAYSKFQAATGASEVEMVKFKDSMEDLYKNNYGESLEDIGDKMSYVKQVMKETDPSVLGELTENAMALEDTFDSDFRETVRGVQNLMKHFGLDSQTAFDLFAKGSQNGLDYTSELGDNIAEYGGNFKQAGYSAEEYFQLLENGTKGGAYNLDKVNDSINEIKNRLGDGTIKDSISMFSGETQKTFKAWEKGEKTMKDVIDSIVKDITNCEDEQKALTMAAKAFGTMGEDANLDVVKSLTTLGDSYKDVKGSMEDLKKIRYDNVTSQLESIGRTLQTDVLAPLAQKILPVVEDTLNFAIDHGEEIITVLGAMAVAFGVMKTAMAAGAMVSTFVSMATAIKGASTAMGVLNAVMNANPIGLVVTAVGLLAAGIVGLTSAFGDNSAAMSEEEKRANLLKEEYEALTSELAENKKAREDAATSATAEASSAEALLKKIEELEKVENKSTDQKKLMKYYVDELNKVVPDLALAYDDEKDALSEGTIKIKDRIKAMKELAMIEAYKSNLTEVYKEIGKAQAQLNKYTEEEIQQAKEYKAAQEALDAFMKEHTFAEIQNNVKLLDQRAELVAAVDKYGEAAKINSKTIGELEATIAELGSEADSTAQMILNSQNALDFTEAFAKLEASATEAGIKIPTSLKSGLESGFYAMPATIAQLQSLMSFNEAIIQAGLEGQQIPQALSTGIMNGTMSVANAVQAAKVLIDFQSSAVKAGADGAAIAAALQNGIANGTIPLSSIVAETNGLIDFTKSVNEALSKGQKIPQSLIDGISTGEIPVSTAVQQMNNWIEFQDALTKANKAGVDIPAEVESGILSGKLKPADAVKQMGDETVKEANKYPTKLWHAGMALGEDYLDGTSTGLLNPRKRIEIYNNSFGVGKDYMNKGLADGTRTQSPSRAAKEIAEYFLDGVNVGLNNRDKKNKIFSNVFSFGNSLLSKLQKSLQENSPSKATEEMGEFLLQGLGIGIENEKDNVLKDAHTVGQDITNALQEELSRNIKLGAIQASSAAFESQNISANTSSQQNALVGALKEAISGMKVELDGEVAGEFVDKTVTRLIYN